MPPDRTAPRRFADSPVGRDREAAALDDCLSAVLSGQVRLVLISGEAGIGKTTLVDWLTGEAKRLGAQVMVGQCYDLAQTPPYGPWRDALGDDASVAASPFVRGADTGVLSSQADLFDRVRDGLADAAVRQPLVLVLEDLHWSDPASLEMLRVVSRDLAALPLLLVATYRGDEVAPRDPLFALLPRLTREARAERIDLGALDAAAIRSLVQQRYALCAADETRLVEYLLLRTSGNPLFVTELLRTLESGRLLTPGTNLWRLGELTRAPVPPLVRQIIEDRLIALPPETLRLLEIAAVIGQEAAFDVWSASSGASIDELFTAAELAVLARLADEPASPPVLAFTHALMRDALYARQPPLTRQARHRRIAETLAVLDNAEASVVASHFALADDPRAVDWHIRAGDQALALYAAQDAVAALGRAQELGARFTRPLPPAAYRTRAIAAGLLGEFDQARRDHELALERGRATGDRDAEWQALLDLGMLWAERDYERTIGHYRAALTLARDSSDQSKVAYSLNRIANWHVNRDEPHIGTPMHEEALAIFTAAGDRAGIAETLDFLGMSAYLDADFPRATAYCEQAAALLRELDDRQRLASCLTILALSGGVGFWIANPLYREARYWISAGEDAVAIAQGIGWSAGEAFARICLSDVVLARGQLGRGLREAEAGFGMAKRIGHEQWLVAGRNALAMAWIELLDPDRAFAELEQGLAMARSSGSRFWSNTFVATLASLSVSLGELSRAAAILGTAAQASPAHRSLSQRQCRFAEAELTLASGETERALTIIDDLVATRAGVASQRPMPQLLKLRGDALSRQGRLAEAEDAYQEARATASLLGFRPLRWRIDRARGDLFEALGRTEEADDARRHALATIEEMAGTLTDATSREAFLARARDRMPPIMDAGSGPPNSRHLSPRELDVLRHLVQGKSDREIAADLSISPRTVMRHVTGILNKLGVSSRTAAATRAMQEQLV